MERESAFMVLHIQRREKHDGCEIRGDSLFSLLPMTPVVGTYHLYLGRGYLRWVNQRAKHEATKSLALSILQRTST
jgi:hypothetical protein